MVSARGDSTMSILATAQGRGLGVPGPQEKAAAISAEVLPVFHWARAEGPNESLPRRGVVVNSSGC